MTVEQFKVELENLGYDLSHTDPAVIQYKGVGQLGLVIPRFDQVYSQGRHYTLEGLIALLTATELCS